MNDHQHTTTLVDHLFRHESGKMIAVLTRLFGMQNLQLAEDVVQEAFIKAMQAWSFNTIPGNPSAWLMQVAKNKALDIIRRQQLHHNYSQELSARLETETEQTVTQFFHDNEISDSQLQMIFACCHPALKEEDQVALTLKTVSGFGVDEIARALLSNKAAIQKRLFRAKTFLKEEDIRLEIPAGHELKERLDMVYTVLYLLFNEGYNSMKSDELIRKDLCAEAMRLCLLLSNHKAGNRPASFALLSLMCFQASRFDSRLDADQSIVLLQQQDRGKWNHALIQLGYQYLNRSSEGNEITIYHIESAIAAEHCLAKDFAATNWERMLTLYDLLLQQKDSPVVRLNRAVVLHQLRQTQNAIRYIKEIEGIDDLLRTQYIYAAVLGELYLRQGDVTNARHFLQLSKRLTPSIQEQHLIDVKLKEIADYNLN